MNNQKEHIERNLKLSLEVIRLYGWLLDLFVLDFFVDNHWDKLPRLWKNCFQDMDPQDFGKIMAETHVDCVLPLSFLALMQAVKALTIPRSKEDISKDIASSFKTEEADCNYSCSNHPRLKNLFLKHVKMKKRHEISLMADIVSDVANKSNCNAVIDFGSGLGHLVRMLAYKNNIYAAGIECQNQLTLEASNLDKELEYTAKKHLTEEKVSELRRPLHINMTLSSGDQLKDLPLPKEMESYGLIGLHPCGDLGPLLLRHFATNDKIKFICVVGCCFMKLTCDGKENGYPMSDYLSKLENKLSYTSREISCHAIEVYCERLKNGNYEDLKVHAFRAALERILVGIDPKLKHAPVRSIKHTNTMTFKSYCSLALERLNISMPTCPRVVSQSCRDVTQWRRVVLLYSLRLALAPLVENIILLDRVLYVLEQGYQCEIRPVFDPKLSPRNHIIIGRKT